MRRVKIFSGSSHPSLTDSICERLGAIPGKCDLKKFSNGETSVDIGCSVRDQDVFIVQSGSQTVNDSIMELLIMISACKGGSANKITAVIPYFPYSKQSKKKSHRGAITARMIANLLTVAGVNHVITVDLHASQMQGFFSRPVDNLYAEPLIARWIRHNVYNWREAVVVSKNPGGTKRVTSLADALKLNFALITTDRRRANYDSLSSRYHSTRHSVDNSEHGDHEENEFPQHGLIQPDASSNCSAIMVPSLDGIIPPEVNPSIAEMLETSADVVPRSDSSNASTDGYNYHLPPHPHDFDIEYTDDHARDVTYGRLIQGHIVDDDYPPPSGAASVMDDDGNALTCASLNMLGSVYSVTSSHEHALGGTIDAHGTDDEEEAQIMSAEEKLVTLVGHVKGKTVLILDDMIDRPGSWIAAAEHCVKRGGAKKVYCIATHGIFGGDCLELMEACNCIDHIIVTNTFPIPEERRRASRKLGVLDVAGLLSEAIRRNHHGESISALFQHTTD